MQAHRSKRGSEAARRLAVDGEARWSGGGAAPRADWGPGRARRRLGQPEAAGRWEETSRGDDARSGPLVPRSDGGDQIWLGFRGREGFGAEFGGV